MDDENGPEMHESEQDMLDLDEEMMEHDAKRRKLKHICEADSCGKSFDSKWALVR